MSSHIFWIADDGSDWGRSSVDRHGRSRIAPPSDARTVTEAQYREHLREVRVARDRAQAQADREWKDQPIRPTLVVEPAGKAAIRQIEVGSAYLDRAAADLEHLADLVHDYESSERVTVTGKVETDSATYAEIVYDLAVDPLPAEVTAVAGSVIHGIQAALDQAHKALVPTRRAEGKAVRVGFPIPAESYPGSPGWPSFLAKNLDPTASDLDTKRATELMDRIWGEVEAASWKHHPMRRLVVLSGVERHQSVARVAAIAEVRGDGMTRVHGLGLGDDFTLPNRADGTQHRIRFALEDRDREAHIDRLRELIARCEALVDDDISFAMYSKDEELTELQRELDSWYPPFDVEVEVNSSVAVMAAGSKSTDLVTELGAMVAFAAQAITRYRSYADRH